MAAHPRSAQSSTAVVVAGGDAPSLAELRGLPDEGLVLAVDRGVEHALAAGFAIDEAVGDFDSVDPAALDAAAASGARLVRYDAAKDQTDLELALLRAVEAGVGRIVVVGAGGGRFDHLAANLATLSSPLLAAVEVEARFGPAVVHVVRSAVALEGEPGALVTLVAQHGPATGVTTQGLLYPLTDATLQPGSSRGVSNEMVARQAEVSVGGGTLLAILPGERGTHLLAGPDPGTSPDPGPSPDPGNTPDTGDQR